MTEEVAHIVQKLGARVAELEKAAANLLANHNATFGAIEECRRTIAMLGDIKSAGESTKVKGFSPVEDSGDKLG